MDYDTIYFYGLLPSFMYFVARGIYHGRTEDMDGYQVPNQILVGMETLFWPFAFPYCLAAAVGRFLRKEARDGA